MLLLSIRLVTASPKAAYFVCELVSLFSQLALFANIGAHRMSTNACVHGKFCVGNSFVCVRERCVNVLPQATTATTCDTTHHNAQ
jgi:hypothetical protein